MKILAAIDGDDAAEQVLDVAGALVPMLGVDLKAVHVGADDSERAEKVADARGISLRRLVGDPAAAIVGALGDDDAVMALLGGGVARREHEVVGHVTYGVITRASKPVVVVPHGGAGPAVAASAKIVIALDGAVATADAVNAVLTPLVERGVDAVAIHVFNAENAPRYWDRFYYDFPVWHEDFRWRNCPSPDTRLEVSRGSVAAEVLGLAVAENATAIALAWCQDLAPGHARVVQMILASARVPVLLIPRRTVAPRPTALSLTAFAA